MVRPIVVLLVLSVWGLWPHPLTAQTSRFAFHRESLFSTQGVLQYWDLNANPEGVNRIREVSFPTILILPLSDRFSLDIYSSGALATREPLVGADEDLEGVSDTRIRGSYIFAEDRGVITLTLNTPTGKNELDAAEASVANALATDALLFRVSNFGVGFDAGLSAAFAQSLGERWVLGVGVGYVLRHEFDIGTGNEYEPGDEANFTLGLDFLASEGLTLSVDGVYTIYGEDELNGATAFESGDKLLVEGRGAFRTGSLDWVLYARNRSRSDHRNFSAAGAFTGLTEVGNQFEAGLSLLYPWSRKVSLNLLADARFYANSSRGGTEAGGAWIVGEGVLLNIQLGRHLSLTPLVKFYTGALDLGAVNPALWGFETGVGATIRF